MKSPRLETVQVDWMGEQQFRLKDHAGFPIHMAQPDGVSGADLLPLSLIGCAAWDVIAILKKQRQEVTHFLVTADSERDPDPPWRFRRIWIHYYITGKKINSDRVRRAIDLTETRYCSIFATLREAVEIVSDYDIVEA